MDYFHEVDKYTGKIVSKDVNSNNNNFQVLKSFLSFTKDTFKYFYHFEKTAAFWDFNKK